MTRRVNRCGAAAEPHDALRFTTSTDSEARPSGAAAVIVTICKAWSEAGHVDDHAAPSQNVIAETVRSVADHPVGSVTPDAGAYEDTDAPGQAT
jgi:hypothetical protein